jgi:aspartyl-tRNA(Asn)/glutamyl-tRNA(Gln) amidotransferase subunit B
VAELRAAVPELPATRRARYETDLGLSAYDAGVLTADVTLADYFEEVVAGGISAKTAANWITGEFSRLLNQHASEGLRASAVALRPEAMVELISDVEAGQVSATNAKAVLASVFDSGESPRVVIERDGLGLVSDAGFIGHEVSAVLDEFPDQVAEYRAGKQQIYGFLVGQVMKRTNGRVDARLVNDELRRQLGS